MSDTYYTNTGAKYSLSVHLVWCPKYRKQVLTGDVRARLIQLIYEICEEKNWRVEALEVLPDHVHLLVGFNPDVSVSRVANAIKGRTSHDLRAEFAHLRSRIPTLWSRSYFASTVGMNHEQVREYIDTQYERPWRKDKSHA